VCMQIVSINTPAMHCKVVRLASAKLLVGIGHIHNVGQVQSYCWPVARMSIEGGCKSCKLFTVCC
jgi:hypothetical protein